MSGGDGVFPLGVRPTFHSAYAMNGEALKRNPGIRLLDCLCIVMPIGDPAYLTDMGPMEFSVLDKKTLDRGIFHRPEKYTDDDVTRMIAQTFGSTATAHQISRGQWLV